MVVRSARNTVWCLFGVHSVTWERSLFFNRPSSPAHSQEQWMMVWGLAMSAGICTSVMLETFILWKQLGPKEAFRTAVGMSMVSMLLMEAAMNLADFGMMGAPAITLSVLPITLGAGFLAAWPYNYWRLKKHGKCCHG